MRILVVQHDDDKGPGLLAAPLEAAGATLEIAHAGRGPLALDGHDAVVALPGLADPPDDTAAVRDTRALLADALAADRPVLGLCLGAELLAEAAGGRTQACEPEFGFGEVELLPAAADDGLLGALPAAFRVFHAHAYAVAEPPAGAVSLARSHASLQAFRLGSRAWGIQFHPEPTVEMLAAWLATVEALRTRVDPEATLAEARLAEPQWERWTAGIAARFAAVVASG